MEEFQVFGDEQLPKQADMQEGFTKIESTINGNRLVVG